VSISSINCSAAFIAFTISVMRIIQLNRITRNTHSRGNNAMVVDKKLMMLSPGTMHGQILKSPRDMRSSNGTLSKEVGKVLIIVKVGDNASKSSQDLPKRA